MEFRYKYIIDQFDQKDLQIKQIGHEFLGRNYVYSVGHNIILKVYTDERNWEREVKSLWLLGEGKKYTPTLIDFGFGIGNEKWILMNRIPGKPLASVVESIDIEEIRSLFFSIGQFHGKFHKNNLTNRYYDWATCSKYYKHFENYQEFEISKNRRRAERLLSEEYKENNLFKKAYENMLNLEQHLGGYITLSICHNDFSPRNILVKKRGEQWGITGLIDFELSHPSCTDSDMTQMIFKHYKDGLAKEYIAGYKSEKRKKVKLKKRLEYYLYALSLEICSWSKGRDDTYYQQAVEVMERLEAKDSLMSEILKL